MDEFFPHVAFRVRGDVVCIAHFQHSHLVPEAIGEVHRETELSPTEIIGNTSLQGRYPGSGFHENGLPHLLVAHVTVFLIQFILVFFFRAVENGSSVRGAQSLETVGVKGVQRFIF